MSFEAIQTAIPDVLIVQPRVFGDERGFFMESYHEERFRALGIPDRFVQDNHSRSSRGVLRGLHYQDRRAPMAKLVRCTRGSVQDVAVDLRADSPTYGRHVMVELSEENRLQLFVPVGFAHGFLVTSESAEVQYKCSAYYAPETEGSVRWDDPSLDIDWPIHEPTLSPKDRSAPLFDAYRRAPVFGVR